MNKVLPKLEGALHTREGKRSCWKKHTFVLRASGLYSFKSGKSLALKGITRVAEWNDVECYSGAQYKKFYRAPGNYCFSMVVSVTCMPALYTLSPVLISYASSINTLPPPFSPQSFISILGIISPCPLCLSSFSPSFPIMSHHPCKYCLSLNLKPSSLYTCQNIAIFFYHFSSLFVCLVP